MLLSCRDIIIMRVKSRSWWFSPLTTAPAVAWDTDDGTTSALPAGPVDDPSVGQLTAAMTDVSLKQRGDGSGSSGSGLRFSDWANVRRVLEETLSTMLAGSGSSVPCLPRDGQRILQDIFRFVRQKLDDKLKGLNPPYHCQDFFLGLMEDMLFNLCLLPAVHCGWLSTETAACAANRVMPNFERQLMFKAGDDACKYVLAWLDVFNTQLSRTLVNGVFLSTGKYLRVVSAGFDAARRASQGSQVRMLTGCLPRIT